MKLSVAIILGEFVLPAIHMEFLRRGADGQFCGGCAVGRTCVAAGYTGKEHMNELSKFMDQEWPWTATYPRLTESMRNWTMINPLLLEMSARYEDYPHQSMKQIAEWIATIEPQEEPHGTPTQCPRERPDERPAQAGAACPVQP